MPESAALQTTHLGARMIDISALNHSTSLVRFCLLSSTKNNTTLVTMSWNLQGSNSALFQIGNAFSPLTRNNGNPNNNMNRNNMNRNNMNRNNNNGHHGNNRYQIHGNHNSNNNKHRNAFGIISNDNNNKNNTNQITTNIPVFSQSQFNNVDLPPLPKELQLPLNMNVVNKPSQKNSTHNNQSINNLLSQINGTRNHPQQRNIHQNNINMNQQQQLLKAIQMRSLQRTNSVNSVNSVNSINSLSSVNAVNAVNAININSMNRYQ